MPGHSAPSATVQPFAIKRTNTLNVSPKQALVIQSTRKFVLAVGGKQSGKSFAGALALLARIHANPRGHFLVVAPTYNKLHDATLARLYDACDYFAETLKTQLIIPSDVREKPHSNEQKKEIVFYNGAKLFYRSADRIEGLEGMTLVAAWIDEAQWIEQDVFEEMQFRTSIKGGQIFITAAVPAVQQLEDHWIYNLYQRWKAGDKEIDFIHFSVYDLEGLTDWRTGRPLLNKKDLEIRRKYMSPEKFRAWVFGEIDESFTSDRLYPHDAVKNAQSRWTEAFSSLPQPLYDYLAARLRERYQEPPPRNENAQKRHTGYIVVGVDPAGLSGDNICVTVRAGKHILTTESWGGMPGPELERALVQLHKDISSLGYSVLIAVDTVGIGNQLPAYLAEKNIESVGVTYNGAPESKDFGNRKAELYFKLQTLLYDQEFCLPPNMELVQQMLETRAEIRNSKIFIKEHKRSPDELDSLIISLGANDVEEIPLYM